MKKLIAILVMAMAVLQVTVARDVVTRDVTKLPNNAREVIKTNFPQSEISYIKIDTETFRSKIYEVTLTDGTELEFDKKGSWIEIDCKKGKVPSIFVPANITQYITQNFPNQFIVKIEKDRRGYDVELSNDLDVKFDTKGNFMRLDD